MRSVVILTIMVGLVTAVEAAAQAPPSPSMPSPVVSPGETDIVPFFRKWMTPGRPLITLGEKRESITPEVHGAAYMEKGAIAVRPTSSTTFTAALTGASHAHAYVFCHATVLATVHLEQEFEVAPGNPATPSVTLSLTAKIDGHLRSDENGAACMRAATATVAPASGGPVLSVGFAPGCVVGRGASRYTQTAQPPPQVVPAGKYVLVADFVFDANVDGFCHGHGEAIFTSDFTADRPLIVPSLPDNPFEKVDKKDFGFRITIEAK
jgi:hypothetical protein